MRSDKPIITLATRILAAGGALALAVTGEAVVKVG
ncbi:enoyl-CoA hydrotase [Aeromonas salmonicida]|nr:enoyl-CoA hydrotase [Aeromonas salmonicida]